MRLPHLTASSRGLEQSASRAPERIAEALQIRHLAPVFVLERLRAVDGNSNNIHSVVTRSAGVAMGIVADGRLIAGAREVAGAGWMIVGTPWKPEYAACGAWETLWAPARHSPDAPECCLPNRWPPPRAHRRRTGARRGAREADYLAMGIANLIAVLNPEMMVLTLASDLFGVAELG